MGVLIDPHLQILAMSSIPDLTQMNQQFINLKHIEIDYY